MRKISALHNCSGCYACASSCPSGCIDMKPDIEGFWYPEIDTDKCVDCGKCDAVCPALNKLDTYPRGEAFACMNLDEEVRLTSSSGGIFTLLAEYVLEKGGTVFGAAYNNRYEVEHIAIDNKKDVWRLRGSKYVQSRIGNSYIDCKQKLENGSFVLFTGTPCQISGLLSFLGKRYDNLLTQDIICHGVPSPMVWQKYLDWECYKHTSCIMSTSVPQFRNKSFGWKKYSLHLEFENGDTLTESFSDNAYLKAFIGNVSLRPSCYSCFSKSERRQSDITLADLWGIRHIVSDMDDDKGTSLVIVNSDSGRKMLDVIKEKVYMRKLDFDTAISYNSAAICSASMPGRRKNFFEDIDRVAFDKAVNNNVKQHGIIYKIMRRIKGMIFR